MSSCSAAAWQRLGSRHRGHQGDQLGWAVRPGDHRHPVDEADVDLAFLETGADGGGVVHPLQRDLGVRLGGAGEDLVLEPFWDRPGQPDLVAGGFVEECRHHQQPSHEQQGDERGQLVGTAPEAFGEFPMGHQPRGLQGAGAPGHVPTASTNTWLRLGGVNENACRVPA